MDHLQQQLAEVQQQIQVEKQKGAEQNKFLVAQLEEQEAGILAQMDEAARAQGEQNHEARVQDASNEFLSYMQAALAELGMTDREMFAGEKEYQLWTIFTQQASNTIIERLSRQVQGSEERELQLRRQNEEMQDKIEALEAADRTKEATRQELTARSAQLEFERDEALRYRDNAVSQLEEARTEIDRLNSQVDDLRKELAVGAREAYKLIDTEDQRQQIVDLAKQIKDSKIKVINMRPAPDDFKRQTWLAEDAATGETYTFNYLEKGKYLELTPEEGLQFRLQHQSRESAVSDHPLAITPPAMEPVVAPQFHDEEDDQTGLELAVPASGDEETVSRADFEALKQRVERLEKNAFGEVAA